MLRSMYSGISGMKVNQTKLDVIGNNIANVNTTGFKSSRAKFADLLSQNSSNAMAPSVNKGGTNAKQVGLGVQLASIDRIMTQGSMQTTNRALDVAIDGDGYFMVSAGPVIDGDGTVQVSHKPGIHAITEQSLQTSGSELSYTRDGGFTVDSEGNLLTTSGYRVMGYSLTNDDSSMAATSVPSAPVEAGGFTFAFGPGSQLNGYSVVLGKIGPGTATDSTVDIAQKKIIINGDFSSDGNLQANQVGSEVNKALTAAGISQSVSVSGTVTPIAGIEEKTISGGSDATAPNKVAICGFTISFKEGADLNDYVFQIGSISAPTLNAVVNDNTTPKKITISGDFINNSVSTAALTRAINDALSAAGKTTQVKDITGSATTLGNIQATTGTAIQSKEPTLSSNQTTAIAITEVQGFTLQVDPTLKGNDLNGYSVRFNHSNGAAVANVDPGTKEIVISGNLDTIDTTNPAAPDYATNVTNLANLNALISQKLANAGVNDAKFEIAGGSRNTPSSNTMGYFRDGVDEASASPKGLNLGGFTLDIPVPSKLSTPTQLDNLDFVIVNINGSGSPTATVNTSTTPNRVEISGDFTNAGGVVASDLQTAINSALGLTGASSIKVSGMSKTYTGLTSDAVSGGTDYKNPAQMDALGIKFNPSGGAALNGYKIVMGAVSPGTKSTADIDTKSKTITVNGDFVTAGALTGKKVADTINNALKIAGVAGSLLYDSQNPIIIGSTFAVSQATNGGTSVQSLGTDGDVYYVNASNNLKSYDGNLKTLKIPEKVKIAGTNTELRVKTYSIDGTGVINATLEDGRVAALGQIAMASFKNPEGLTSSGNNLFNKSVNSGDPVIKTGTGTLCAEDNSAGYGKNIQGYLEMSNVDLAEQFTDMIVTTKAFQASSKMISTGDDILTEIINLKR